MKLKLATSLSRHYRKGKVMYIFKDIPYWFVASSRMEGFMNQLEKGVNEETFNRSVDSSTKSLVGGLVKMGVVSEDNCIKGEIQRYVPKKRIWEVYDVAEFELTLKCNLRCKHCYISAGHSEGEEMTPDEIKLTLDDLHKIHKGDMRGKRIVLTGGEPFVREDIIEIVDLIKERGFRTLINSNGLLIRKDQIEHLSNYEALQICVSLDGKKESHEKIRGRETYESTLRKIRELSDSGIPTAINMLCHRGNYKELSDVINDTKDINLQGVNPVSVVLMGRAREMGIEPIPEKELYQEIFRMIKEDPLLMQRMGRTSLINFMAGLAVNVKSHYCGTGTRGTYFISSIGDIFPCPNMRFDQFKLGNIRERKFKDIVENSPVIERLKCLSVDKMNEKCPKCDVKYFCGGFCRGETFANTGDLNAPYVRCEDYREGILEAMWELAENPKLVEKRTREFLENAKQLSS